MARSTPPSLQALAELRPPLSPPGGVGLGFFCASAPSPAAGWVVKGGAARRHCPWMSQAQPQCPRPQACADRVTASTRLRAWRRETEEACSLDRRALRMFAERESVHS